MSTYDELARLAVSAGRSARVRAHRWWRGPGGDEDAGEGGGGGEDGGGGGEDAGEGAGEDGGEGADGGGGGPEADPQAPEPVPTWRGALDRPEPDAVLPRGLFEMTGWCAVGDRPMEAVSVAVDGVSVGRAVVGARRDDVALSTRVAPLAHSGWTLTADLGRLPENGPALLVVTAWPGPGRPPIDIISRRIELVDAPSELAPEPSSGPGRVAAGEDDGTTGPPAPGAFASVAARTEVTTVMAWIAEAARVETGPLVSVTVATRDRVPLLRQAVESVLAQSYPHFELVLVDDSDGDETAAYLADLGDTRVRVVRTSSRRGAGAAYNAGLDAATGDLIAFLDDDNLMHREWLRSVVWAFATFPQVDALYGARIIERLSGPAGEATGFLPMFEFDGYDRRRHEDANYIDRNTVAIRAHLRTVRFDEQLRGGVDWEHGLRLFAQAEPLALPAVACYYGTTANGRISNSPDKAESLRRIRARAHTTRALRVNVLSAIFPVQSETYIGEDVASLQDAGAIVTAASVHLSASRIDDAPPIRYDVEAALAEDRPDVVLMHWSWHAIDQLYLMEHFALPFACRVHSFDVDAEPIQVLLDHPLCVGVYAHDHFVPRLPDGVKAVPVVVTPRTEVPPFPGRRDLVVSASAGLPKKDFRLLVDAFRQVEGIEREIVVARTNGFEDLPDTLIAEAAAADPTIRVSVNLQQPDVLERMARASVVVYTLKESSKMGVPMSIIEGMLCGAIVIAPDRPESWGMVGEHLRPYRTADDIARHIAEVVRGGPEIEAARRALRRRAEEHHRDPAVLRVLHDTLRDDLTAWRYARG